MEIKIIESDDCGGALFVDDKQVYTWHSTPYAEELVEALLPFLAIDEDVTMESVRAEDYDWDQIWIQGQGFVQDWSTIEDAALEEDEE